MQRSSRIELVVAASAVFISLASFWLAWKQTDAMDAQVKAMSWPYLQLRSGNFNMQTQERSLSMGLQNAGVGPTRVAWFVLTYNDVPVSNFTELAQACCIDADGALVPIENLNAITGDPSPMLLPAGGDQTLFQLMHQSEYDAFWNAMDQARWSLQARACHCSILDQCWVTDFESDPVEIEACPPAPSEDWRG